MQEKSQLMHLQRTNYDGKFAAHTTMIKHGTGFPSDSNSDNNSNSDNKGCHRPCGDWNFSVRSSVGNRGNDSLMEQYSVKMMAIVCV